MNSYPLAVAATVILLITGCAPQKIATIPLAKENIGITVIIDPNITVPEDIYIHTRANTIGAPFGLLGAAIAGSSSEVMEVIQKNQINLKELLIGELNTQLAGLKSITLSDSGSAKATLKYNIIRYGFTNMTKEEKFKAGVRPFIVAEAQLVTTNGSVVWQKRIVISPDHQENGIDTPLDDLIKNPSSLKEALRLVCKLLAKDTVIGLSA
jgi:hypothetical protein